MQLPSVLTIAGSDSSGGAGIQADLKTIAALGLYGQSVITALTAQNTCGVRSIQETSVQVVIDQMDAVYEDIRPAAVKIGMLSTSQIAHTVAQGLRRHGAGHIVVDPVMVATSGAALMADGASRSMVDELFCLAQVVTPNIPEASVLTGIDAAAQGLDSMVQAARIIARATPGAVLVKGGHLAGEGCATDVLLLPGADNPVILRGEAVQTRGTHGTGCTLSSAIACFLAYGLPVEEAVRRAKDYLATCLRAGLGLGRGNGPLDHMAPLRSHIAVPQVQVAAPRIAPAGPCVPGPALIVGGSPEAPTPEFLRHCAQGCSLVIACDSGADACMRAGLHVDVLVGDGDSLSFEALTYVRAGAAQELGFPMDKDDTDLGLALSWLAGHAVELGVSGIVATGITGGRVDHELGVFGVLARMETLPIRIETPASTVHVLSCQSNPHVIFCTQDVGRTLSVVALPAPACLSESGMRWNLDHATLNTLDDLGISNVIEQDGAVVEVHAGTVFVIVERERIHKESIL